MSITFQNHKSFFFREKDAENIPYLLFENLENGVKLSDEDILEEVKTFMFAVSGEALQRPSIVILQRLECEAREELSVVGLILSQVFKTCS